MAQFSDGGDAPEIDRLRNGGIVDAAGHSATVVSTMHDGDDMRAWIRLADGMQVLVQLSLLARQANGVYRLPFALDNVNRQPDRTRITFPVRQEVLAAGKRPVDTGRGVRLRKSVAEHAQTVEQTLLCDELSVEQVPVGQAVAADDPPRTRYEGDTLVVPVLEEVLVVQKQLHLKEELRITRRQHARQARQTVPVRSEQIEVERFDENGEQA